MPTQFDTDLNRLMEKVLNMGALAEEMMRSIILTLEESRTDLLGGVYGREAELDRLQNLVDEETVRLIGVYTPVAGDLRLLLMLTRINAEIERVGDKVVEIGHTMQSLLEGGQECPIVRFSRIAVASQEMVRNALDALVDRSSEKALAVIRADDEVDALSDETFRSLLTHMLEDPRRIGFFLGQIFTVRAFERIADHAVNIAEDVIYVVKGKDVRHGQYEKDGGAREQAAEEAR